MADPTDAPAEPRPDLASDSAAHHGLVNGIVRTFLNSNLPLILLVLATALGAAALMVTPREEDPQIVVPLADIFVNVPGKSAAEVEQLVSTPLERILYQIDGVEYVYSMSRQGQAIITVRFYVGQDRERSLVKLFKQIDEHIDIVPPSVTGWVIKPIEIDDVPIVTLTLASSVTDSYLLRRQADEMVERLAAVPDTSRAYVVGGRPRVVYVYLDAEHMQGWGVSPLEVQRAIQAANLTVQAGSFDRNDQVFRVDAGKAFARPGELGELVIAAAGDRPIFLKDVAHIQDGPAEIDHYVRHGWGPARADAEPSAAGALVGPPAPPGDDRPGSQPAVTIALSKKKGSNAVTVGENIIRSARDLKARLVGDDVEMIVTRNYGLSSDQKVNELVEALVVALIFSVIVLWLGLGWRESLIVALAVPVVFGLTLAINLLFGLTINRVTLFALILSLGLLVDDPIVDVENIVRHFRLRGRATRGIVLEAVAEIRPPLIAATLAVIASFIPLFFITGMMGPYMRPMALNVPVTMLMSMLVAFTLTPWLAYQILKRHYNAPQIRGLTPDSRAKTQPIAQTPEGNPVSVPELPARPTALHRVIRATIAPLITGRWRAWAFLGVIALLTVGALALGAYRLVPLKMLPYGNKDQFQLLLDLPEGTTLERTDAAIRDLEDYLRTVPEMTDFTSYVGLAAPMDFNGMVRHYYLRQGDNVGDIQINVVDRTRRAAQTHEIALRLRDDLTAIAHRHNARLKIVEVPPGPPVLSTLVAEVYGQPDNTYADLIDAADTVMTRLRVEPGVKDVDWYVEAPQIRYTFVVDKEKATLHGVSTQEIVQTVQLALSGADSGTISMEHERHPLAITLRLPRADRSSLDQLAGLWVRGAGHLVPLAELGKWDQNTIDRTIYHKNLHPVVYVLAETVGRTPAEAVLDIQADQEIGVLTPDFRATTQSMAQTQPGNPATVPEFPHAKTQPAAQTQPGKPPTAPQAPECLDPAKPSPQTPPANPAMVRDFPAGITMSGWVSSNPPKPVASRTFLAPGGGIPWAVPNGIRVDFSGEGEWNITLDVFRDMGLAFAAAVVAIYILLVAQTGSFVIPVVTMLAIPLTILGIMPGFWLLNAVGGAPVGAYANPVFFTATAMIGMIALAGIVTRNSIILIDFFHLSLRQGQTLHEAILHSVAVRLRPILLTAATALLSSLPIVMDPIFSGLAWALIFGLLASTLFTLFVIPAVYWLLYANKPGHGLPLQEEEIPPAKS